MAQDKRRSIQAQLYRGRGPLPNQPVTFYLIGDSGSLSDVQDGVAVRTANRTSPEGIAYTEYFPQADAVHTAALGAVYFEKGRPYTASISLQVVTDQGQYDEASAFLTPPISPHANSDDAAAARVERQQLIRDSEGQLDPQALSGLIPLLETWYDGAIHDSLQVAEGTSQAFQAGYDAAVSFATLRQRYQDAERDTAQAGSEILEWLANIQMLGLEITPELTAALDATAAWYGQLLQQAIERNLTFLRSAGRHTSSASRDRRLVGYPAAGQCRAMDRGS